MLIDSHCHLDFDKITKDFDGIKQRAKEADVIKMLSAGVTIKDFNKLYELIDNEENFYCSVGIHPHYASDEYEKNISVEELVKLSEKPKVLGIGECGFDFYYDHSSKIDQEEVFRKQIIASQQSKLPIIIHTRDADEDTSRILIEAYKEKKFNGVIHCFTASYDFAMKMLDIGFYISVSGIITFSSADDIRKTIREVPLDRLLVETDSPYLAPKPYRGKTNEPSYVAFVADKLAEIKGVSKEEIQKITTENFMRLYKKCK